MIEQFTAFVEAQLQNEFFAGGSMLMLMGVAMAGARYAWLAGVKLVKRTCIWSVTVENQNDVYWLMLFWLADTGAFRRMRDFRLDEFHFWDHNPDETGRLGATSLTPGAGYFWFVRDATFVIAQRTVGEHPPSGHRTKPETLSLTLLSLRRTRADRVFNGWVAAARSHSREENADWPRFYANTQYDGWVQMSKIRPRKLASIVTPDRAGERIVADARQFLDGEAWYAERNIPWRRGYLLYGPPGAGKSSMIRAVVSELGLDLAIVDLTASGVTDASLRTSLAKAPRKAALVLEDIDAAFDGRKVKTGEGDSSLTFSGLLNALDGLAAQEGRLLFMTTNHRDKLDPALIRPGRADMQIELRNVGPREAALIYGRFFPTVDLTFRMSGCAGEVSPAAVQAALLENSGDPDAALRSVKALFAPSVSVAAE